MLLKGDREYATATAPSRVATAAGDASYRAWALLRIGFTVAPILAGVDKFLHYLANWDQYLAPQIAGILPITGHQFMLVVGVVEILAGLLVAIRPRIGGYVVAAWLAGIMVNLLIQQDYYDVALRDLGLCFGALALAWLSGIHQKPLRQGDIKLRRDEGRYEAR